MKRTKEQQEIKILLAHCVINDERLKKELLEFLKQNNTSFILLLELIGVEINTFNEKNPKGKLTLPLTLSGKITRLTVRDKNNKRLHLSLSKSFILLKEAESDCIGNYLINSKDFSLNRFNVFYSNGSSFSISDSFIVLKSTGSSVTIILNDDQDCSSFFKTIAQLCVDALSNCCNSKPLKVDKILEFLDYHNFSDFTVLQKNLISA